MTHRYGYLPDKEDKRDYLFRAVQKAEQLPRFVDLRPYCSKVRDQGELGSCTGFAMSYLREFMERKNLPASSWIQKLLFRMYLLSPLFLYYQERVLEGTVNQDSGAEIRDGMKVLATMGVCREYKHPYIPLLFMNEPNKYAVRNALLYKITVYSRINTLMDIKSALAQKHGVVFGFYVYESFDTDEVADNGIMPMPERGEQILGGHAVFVCGYNDDTQRLLIKNSWGQEWGQAGYFEMPYTFVTPDNVADIWTATM